MKSCQRQQSLAPLQVWFLRCRKQFPPGNTVAAKWACYLRAKEETPMCPEDRFYGIYTRIWHVTDDSGYSDSTNVESSCSSSCSFSPSTPVASENMDVLYDKMSLPDLIEWAATETVKQVMGKNWLMKELGKSGKTAEIVFFTWL